MSISRRRRIAWIISIGAAVLAGLLSLAAAAGGDSERITSYWVGGVLTDSGLHVTEVIDYDFGPSQRHGIFRDIPDVSANSVEVSSPTAPVDTEITEGSVETKIRIGDPNRTISGRHRYRIDYVVNREAVLRDGTFAWDAIGTRFDVGISNVHIELAGAGALTMPQCATGTRGDAEPCAIDQHGSGQWTTTIDGLATGDGVTLSGRLSAPSATGQPLVAPSGEMVDPGSGLLSPFLVALISALLAAIAATLFARRAGRDRVWDGGAADAAFAETTEGLTSSRVDEKDLAQMATLEFEPPRDMSSVEGGILIEEKVLDQHLSAWLLESAIRQEIEIEGDQSPTLRRGTAVADPAVAPILSAMFENRAEFQLDGYDSKFSKGWERLKDDLSDWLHGSAHWDPRGRKNRRRARWLAAVGVILGIASTLTGAALANRTDPSWLILVGIGAAVFGAAVALAATSFELLRRTELGSALWLRVESFRRFLATSEARHVDEAATRGVLRQYTAWAVALGESDAWTKAVRAHEAANPSFAHSYRNDLLFVAVGSHVSAASTGASTSPGSSGGGFGGSVGGGGGGGGGGSW